MTEFNAAAPVIANLGQFWLREIDEGMADAWNSQLAPIAGELTDDSVVIIEEQDLEQLAVDYCSLFVGPKGHLLPIQSVWTTGQLVSAATHSMKTYCERLDFTVCNADTPADHLGIQLCVYSLLLSNIETDEHLKVVAEYTQAHLAWTDQLLAQVEKANTARLYTQMGVLTKACLSELQSQMLLPE